MEDRNNMKSADFSKRRERKKQRKYLPLFLMLILSLIFITACGNGDTPSGSGSEKPAGTHTVIDHTGAEVSVPDSVSRIVVLDIYPLPSMIATFFGKGESIVGMAAPSMKAAKSSILSTLYPKMLDAATDFINGTTVNMESLLLLKPDVVFYNAGNQASGEALRKANIPAVAISAGKWNYDPLDTLDGWVKTLADVFQNESTSAISRYEKVRDYGKNMQEMIDYKLSDMKAEEEKTLFFLFQYTAENRLTAGNPSFGSEWARRIHARHVVTEPTTGNSLPVNMEQIYAWDPDTIFVTNFSNANAKEILSGNVFGDDWSGLRAQKEKNVYQLPMGLYRTYTAGTDTPIALLWMAKTLYPEHFADIDMAETVREYYSDVMGISLTDEEIESILNPKESGM